MLCDCPFNLWQAWSAHYPFLVRIILEGIWHCSLCFATVPLNLWRALKVHTHCLSIVRIIWDGNLTFTVFFNCLATVPLTCGEPWVCAACPSSGYSWMEVCQTYFSFNSCATVPLIYGEPWVIVHRQDIFGWKYIKHPFLLIVVRLSLQLVANLECTLIVHLQVIFRWKSIKHPFLLIVVRLSLQLVANLECSLIVHRQVIFRWKSIKHPFLLIVVRLSLYIVANPESTLPVSRQDNLGWISYIHRFL